MAKDNDRAEADAIIRRDAPGKVKANADCGNCHKTTLSVSPDENGVATHDPRCLNCGWPEVS